jgi:hypothetical protein
MMTERLGSPVWAFWDDGSCGGKEQSEFAPSARVEGVPLYQYRPGWLTDHRRVVRQRVRGQRQSLSLAASSCTVHYRARP